MDITDILDSELKFDKSSVAIFGPGADLDDASVFYYLNRNNSGKTYILDKEDSIYPAKGFGNLTRFKGLLESFIKETNIPLSRDITHLYSESRSIDKTLPEKVDIISYRGVFHYMGTDDLARTVISSFKTLKPSGKIVIMTRKNHQYYPFIKGMLQNHNLKIYDISNKEFYRVSSDESPQIPVFTSFDFGETPIYSLSGNTVAFEPRFLTDRLLIAENN